MDRRYYKFGDKGLSDVLRQHGFQRYRGRKKNKGNLRTTPNFWTVTNLQDMSEGKIFDWYKKQQLDMSRDMG